MVSYYWFDYFGHLQSEVDRLEAEAAPLRNQTEGLKDAVEMAEEQAAGLRARLVEAEARAEAAEAAGVRRLVAWEEEEEEAWEAEYDEHDDNDEGDWGSSPERTSPARAGGTAGAAGAAGVRWWEHPLEEEGSGAQWQLRA